MSESVRGCNCLFRAASVLGAAAVFVVVCAGPGTAAEPKSGAGKVTLLGDDLSGFRGDTGEWQVVGEVKLDPDNPTRFVTTPGKGVAVNGPAGRTKHLFSRHEHGDVEAHIEFVVPKHSNSGVYFQGRYEIQILDSWGLPADHPLKHGDCGGIYQRWDPKRKPPGFEGHAPRHNFSRPAGQWQTFDVIFRAPRFDTSGKKIANARFVEVLHNGRLIHEDVEVTGPTRAAAFRDEKPTGPLMFQGDHGPVAYRNVWLRALPTE